MGFGSLDYVLLLFSTITSLLIGIYFIVTGRKNRDAISYFSGGGKLPILPVVCSQFVTFVSVFGLIGVPAEIYAYGFSITFGIIGMTFAYLFQAFVLIPVFYPLKLNSIYKYFYLRYGDNKIRYMAVTLNLLFNIMYAGVVLFGTSLVMQTVVNLPYWSLCALFAAIAGVYTAFGGFVAVIWTDVFQTFVMLLGTISVLIKSIIDSGGLTSVIEHCTERLDCVDFNLDPTIRHTVWNVSFGTFFQNIYFTTSQQSLQRFNSLQTARKAQIMVLIVLAVCCVWELLISFEGLAIFAYYSVKGCDPIASGKIINMNQIVPIAVQDIFQHVPGMSGLYLAALTSASLSTLSSSFNSLGAIVYGDIIKEYFPQMSEKYSRAIPKLCVLLFSALCFVFSLLLSGIKAPIGQIFICVIGSTIGPLVGMFLISLYCQRATSNGVAIGACVGVLFSGWIALGQTFSSTLPRTPHLPFGPTINCSITGHYKINDTDTVDDRYDSDYIPFAKGIDKLYAVSYTLVSVIGALATISVGIIASHICKNLNEEVDDRCIVSVNLRACCLSRPGWLKGLRRVKTNNVEENKRQNETLDETTEFLENI